MPNNLAMFPTGENTLKVLAPLALDSSNEEDILLSLHHLFRGMNAPAHLRLYHAITAEKLRFSPTAGESFLHQFQTLREESEKQLRTYTSLLQERAPAHLQVDFWVESQDVASPAEEIAQYLLREAFSLLVVTFKQRRRWERFFGTTALWDILETAPIPMLVLSAPLTIPPKRILWAGALSAEEFPLLQPLIHMVKTFKATLYCAKISTPYAFTTHRSFQRHVLAMCDYIIEQVDPDFVPEECLLYADKDLGEGILHAAQDFLMDIVALSANETLDWKVLDKLLSQQMPVLLLRHKG